VYSSHRDLLGTVLWSRLCQLAPANYRGPRNVLLRQGDPATHVVALAAGAVLITRRGLQGQPTLLAVRGVGELLGDLALLDGGTRTASVTAMEPCRLHIVPATEFTRFVAEHQLMAALLRHTIGRLRETEQIRVELATADVSARLAAALARLIMASAAARDGSVSIRLTQSELARLIGASRNAVGSTLAEWRAQGWVTTFSGGGLTVRNVAALDRLTTAV
jgi:CRP-like cAMP-binding protein